MRFRRMPFGILSASEIIQKRNHKTFGDIPGVQVIADNMIITASTIAEHDQMLHKLHCLLQICCLMLYLHCLLVNVLSCMSYM